MPEPPSAGQHPASPHGSHTHGDPARGDERKRPLIRSWKLWVPVGVVIVLIAVAVGGIALYLGNRAVKAKDELEAAIPLAHDVQNQIAASDPVAAQASAAAMLTHTSKAHELAGGKLWTSLEWVPEAGTNLKAVRLAATAVDEMTRNAIVPVSKINADVFKPKDGRIDVQGIRALSNTVDDVEKSLTAVRADLKQIDRSALVPQVASGISQLDDEVTKANGLLAGVQNVVKVLPGALGADGPKNYLMLFENNAETRGWAGNPAAMLLVHVDNGKISIAKQRSSTDFHNARAKPIFPLDKSTEALYGSKIGRYVQDITTPADFPYTAKLAQAFWAKSVGGHLDGVMSFDPVALSYLLHATGPIKLAGGHTLTAQNAVPLLLNQVYFKYSDPKVQDAFFAAAAASVFDALQSGHASTKPLIDAVTKAANEHRLLLFSTVPAIQKLIAETPMVGVPPADNQKANAVGVFFDDTTGAKMDYYFKPTISVTSDQCAASAPTMHGTVTMTSTAPKDAASSLPAYILGPYFHGRIAMDVVLYGPVGGSMSHFTVNGHAVKPHYAGRHLGRPAVKVSVKLSPGQKLTLRYTMTGKAGTYGPLQVLTTGLTRPTPVTLSTPGCTPKA